MLLGFHGNIINVCFSIRDAYDLRRRMLTCQLRCQTIAGEPAKAFLFFDW